jgi:hypothetical protein
MKKYLFGALALVLAIGFSAFTKPAKKKGTQYAFSYTQTAFQNATTMRAKTNWTPLGEASEADLQCESLTPTSPVGCEIIVDASATVSNAGTALSNNLSSEVVENALGSGKYKVIATGVAISAFNQEFH